MGDESDEAVDLIRAAFPPRPLDPDAARDEWHVGTVNTTEFMDAVRGKRWDELPAKLLERHHDALSMLGPNALVAVLPAYLVAMFRGAPELDMLPTFLLGTLTREPATAQRFDARLAPLDHAQRRAIARALAVWGESPLGVAHRVERRGPGPATCSRGRQLTGR